MLLVGAGEGVNHDVGGIGDLAVHGGAHSADEFEGDVARGLVDQLGEDAGAVRKVPVHSADADVRGVGDGLGGQGLDAAFGDQLQGGVEESTAHFTGPLLLGPGPGSGGHRRLVQR